MLLTRATTVALLLCAAAASAQTDTTRDSLSRLEETLQMRRDDGSFTEDITPAIVVSVAPAYEESRKWFPTAALRSLGRVFGNAGLRACEACMQPRLDIQQGRIEHNTADPTTAEIIKLDDAARGTAAPAKTAIWLDETASGVSIKIVDLRTSRIVLAENFDPKLSEQAATGKRISMARELDRRNRRDALTHLFIDFAVYPGQHVSFDWSEQWGDNNLNLSGVSISMFDPFLGLGLEYFRIIPQALNVMVGAKLLVALPTAIVSAITGSGQQIIDPLINGVLMVRLPIASSNFAIIMSISTNLRFGIGLSLMNFSFLPFLP